MLDFCDFLPYLCLFNVMHKSFSYGIKESKHGFKKIYRTNKVTGKTEVAILITPKHGGFAWTGDSTKYCSSCQPVYSPECPDCQKIMLSVERRLFDATLITILLCAGNPEPCHKDLNDSSSIEVDCYLESHYQEYDSNKRLSVRWVDIDKKFIIREYDGLEHVEVYEPSTWFTGE